MESVFRTPDLIVFFVSLIGAMAVGLYAGRKEKTSEDYFLAGRKIPWWGVAGSIFGSNVSANHTVGMMGIGFSVGFAQSHFELGAVAGLMLLCYGFLPVYRKLRVYTLSEYLGRRYDDRSRVAYAIIMIIIMAVVQMVPALYIGARSICILLGGDAVQRVVVSNHHQPAQWNDDFSGSAGNQQEDEPAEISKLNVDPGYYMTFVIALAVIAASYTIFGGLKAVVWTDVIQSVLLLAASILVAVLTFRHLGGWGAMMEMDRAGAGKMHLYLPSNHPELPWTGVFTGLMALHFFYWGTNQFIVQRALGARSDKEARQGIIAAGFLKMLIPFFAIATGVAASYLLLREYPNRTIPPDTAFTEIVKLVIPVGWGIIGLIAAGLIGAILSSIDSMMNSAATIITFDLYKRYVNPRASDRLMILVGRISIVLFVAGAAWMAIYVLDPNSEKNFFLEIVNYQTYLVPGLLIAFMMGMFWRRATATAALVTILGGIIFSGLVEYGYNEYVGTDPTSYQLVTGQLDLNLVSEQQLPSSMHGMSLAEKLEHLEQLEQSLKQPLAVLGSRWNVLHYLGPRLNLFHRVLVVIVLCKLLLVAVSLLEKPDPEKEKLTWTALGGHSPEVLRRLVLAGFITLGVYAALGWAMVSGLIAPPIAAVVGALWTMAMFAAARVFSSQTEAAATSPSRLAKLVRDDVLWAGLLCSAAVFMMYYFY